MMSRGSDFSGALLAVVRHGGAHLPSFVRRRCSLSWVEYIACRAPSLRLSRSLLILYTHLRSTLNAPSL